MDNVFARNFKDSFGPFVNETLHGTPPKVGEKKSGSIFPKVPATAQEQLGTRTFGVEIECLIPNPPKAGEQYKLSSLPVVYCLLPENEWYNEYFFVNGNKIRNTVSNFLKDVAPGWRAKGDPSIHGGVDIEVVSPILQHTKEAYEQIALVCAALEHLGAIVNNDCGLHVHVNGRDLTAKDVRIAVKRYATLETVIDNWMDSSRKNNDYCKSVIGKSIYPTVSDNTSAINMVTDNDSGRLRNHEKRYFKVNVHALRRHGTLEFRHHHGTLDERRIVAWAQFCTALVQAAKNGKFYREPVSGGEPVEKPSEDRKKFLEALKEHFNRFKQEDSHPCSWLFFTKDTYAGLTEIGTKKMLLAVRRLSDHYVEPASYWNRRSMRLDVDKLAKWLSDEQKVAEFLIPAKTRATGNGSGTRNYVLLDKDPGVGIPTEAIRVLTNVA